MPVVNRLYSLEHKAEARDLRKYGLSLGEISIKLAIPKNTIQWWVKDITLAEKQKKRIKQKEILSAMKGRALARLANKKKLENWKDSIRKKVYKYRELPFKDKNIGKIVCAILYICEGGKYPTTRHLAFGNSDPGIIRLFLKLLRDNFDIDESKFRCRAQHRYDQQGEELEKFWSKITKIPLNKFYKSCSDKRTKGKPTKKIDYKGVCYLQYHDTSLQFELQSMGKAIIKMVELEGFEPSTSTLPASHSPTELQPHV